MKDVAIAGNHHFPFVPVSLRRYQSTMINLLNQLLHEGGWKPALVIVAACVSLAKYLNAVSFAKHIGTKQLLIMETGSNLSHQRLHIQAFLSPFGKVSRTQERGNQQCKSRQYQSSKHMILESKCQYFLVLVLLLVSGRKTAI